MKTAVDFRLQIRALQAAAATMAVALLFSAVLPGAMLETAPIEVRGNAAVQTVAVHNNTFRTLRFTEVACNFLSGDRIVDAGTIVIRDIGLFETGSGLIAGRRGAMPERADCRIVRTE